MSRLYLENVKGLLRSPKTAAIAIGVVLVVIVSLFLVVKKTAIVREDKMKQDL